MTIVDQFIITALKVTWKS